MGKHWNQCGAKKIYPAQAAHLVEAVVQTPPLCKKLVRITKFEINTTKQIEPPHQHRSEKKEAHKNVYKFHDG